MYFKIVLLVAIFSAVLADITENSDKLKVSIFYESHCPCSTSFIKKNFYPAYKSLHNFIEVELIPYGNTKLHEDHDHQVFNCKRDHISFNGDCKANKVHACAVHQNNTQDNTLAFVDCIVDGEYNHLQLAYCSHFTHMDLTSIQQCVDGDLSNQLLSMFANRTEQYPLNHIPAVIFNDSYNRTLDEFARDNFFSTACSLFQGHKPQPCGFTNGTR